MGWDVMVVQGNFVLLSTEWWMSARVQRFLHLVLSSGDHFRFRWNEQSVMAMLWQIFVKPENFAMLDFGYMHSAFDDPAARCGYRPAVAA